MDKDCLDLSLLTKLNFYEELTFLHKSTEKTVNDF